MTRIPGHYDLAPLRLSYCLREETAAEDQAQTNEDGYIPCIVSLADAVLHFDVNAIVPPHTVRSHVEDT
jgi:hypothetical protein